MCGHDKLCRVPNSPPVSIPVSKDFTPTRERLPPRDLLHDNSTGGVGFFALLEKQAFCCDWRSFRNRVTSVDESSQNDARLKRAENQETPANSLIDLRIVKETTHRFCGRGKTRSGLLWQGKRVNIRRRCGELR